MLLQADALEIPLARGSVDLIVTSPPYYNARDYAHWKSYEEYYYFMMEVFFDCYDVIKESGRICVNVPHGYDRPGNGGYKAIGCDTTYMLKHVGFELRGHIIWSKRGASPQSQGTAWGSWKSASNPSLRDEHEIIIVAHKGGARLEPVGESTIDRETFLEATKSVWEIRPAQSWHPAPFPAEIPRRLIELYSYRGSVVYDPFVGSGTTVQVAKSLGRVGIGSDKSMEFLRMADIPIALENKDWERVVRLMKKEPQGYDGLPLFTE